MRTGIGETFVRQQFGRPLVCRAARFLLSMIRLMNPTPEISQSLLVSGLATAVNACASGQSADQAIAVAVQHIRARQTLSLRDEAKVRDWLERELPQAIRQAAATSEPEEKPAGDSAKQLYRMTGPTKFTAVGKPPFIFPPLWLYRLIDGQTVRKLSPDCIRRRKIIISGAALACLLAGLFPPWIQTVDLNTTHTQTDAGYGFLFSPPAPREYSFAIGIRLDDSRLRLEAACLLAASLAAWFLFGGEKQNDRKP